MKKTRKAVSAALLAALTLSLCLLTGCGSNAKSAAIEKYGSDVLKLFNWGEYMGETLISDFEKEFGVKVIVELYDSNETMYTKVQAGDSYDVLVPSDYMIERLLSEDKLQPIDKSLIPNMSVLPKEMEQFDYDPGFQYSVPYFWGSVGIVYNKNNVNQSDLETQGFSIMKNPEYKGRIYMYDSERDSFMIALKSLGYSMNSNDEAEIGAAYDWLVELQKTMDPITIGDEVIDGMINGVKDLAIVYSGDAVTILDENEEMSYFTPAEGTNIWVDAMVIPKNAENPKLAHEFINYVLTYEASYGNSEAVGYASTNKDVLADMGSGDGIYAENVAYLPRGGYAKDEIFHDNEVIRRMLSELWIKVKASN